jgi:hypothetical protein
MDLFDTLTFVGILGRTTFLGTLSLTVPIGLGKKTSQGKKLSWWEEKMGISKYKKCNSIEDAQ